MGNFTLYEKPLSWREENKLSKSKIKGNIFLLRESLELGKLYYESGYKFCLLDIDEFKICIPRHTPKIGNFLFIQ